MKFKFNPLTGEFNLVPDSGTLKQKLNWLTGNFNLTKDAGKYKQIYNVIEGEFNLYPATTQVVIHGTGSVQLTNAVENGLLLLTAYGGTEQRNLPSGYTEVEYIQSSGTQYIDTLRVPNNNDIIEQKFQKLGTLATTCSWYGSMPSSQSITPRIGIGSFPSQGVATLFAGINYTGAIREADTNVHTLRFQATGIQELTYTLDGVTGVIDASTSATPIDMFDPAVELTSYLFARHGTNGVQVYDNEGTKIYYHKEYLANGTLVLNMVPAKRNSDNVLGMYDLVSGQFFTNQGTGTFTAGPNAVPTPDNPMDIISNNGTLKVRHQSGLPLGYTLLDYILGTDIDTGYNTNQDTEIEAVWYKTNSTSSYLYQSDSQTSGSTNTTAYLSSPGNWRFDGTTTSISFSRNQKYTTIQNKEGVWIDGDKVGTYNDVGNFTSTATLKISSSGSYLRIYSLKIRENGALLYDYVPVMRESDNTYGLYDLVNQEFITGTNMSGGEEQTDPIEIYADGTTETILSHGKNLYNKENGALYGYPSNDGVWTQGSSEYSELTIMVKLNEGGTYTVTRLNGGNSVFRIQASPTAILTNAQSLYIIDNTGNTETNVKTFTVPIGYPYVLFYVRNIYNSNRPTAQEVVNAFQVELGSTATEYEPYYSGGTATAEMLLKIGDYADEQEILSGNITRKVGIKVFDGTETFINGQNGWITQDVQNQIGENYYPYCTHFVGTNNTPIVGSNTVRVYRTSGEIGRIYFGIDKTIYTSTTVFQQWLADQYNAGTPVIIVYLLATPTTETVTGQTISVPEGTSTIGIIEASLDNLELEAVYEQEA